jgi:hypothetical protein
MYYSVLRSLFARPANANKEWSMAPVICAWWDGRQYKLLAMRSGKKIQIFHLSPKIGGNKLRDIAILREKSWFAILLQNEIYVFFSKKKNKCDSSWRRSQKLRSKIVEVCRRMQFKAKRSTGYVVFALPNLMVGWFMHTQLYTFVNIKVIWIQYSTRTCTHTYKSSQEFHTFSFGQLMHTQGQILVIGVRPVIVFFFTIILFEGRQSGCCHPVTRWGKTAASKLCPRTVERLDW